MYTDVLINHQMKASLIGQVKLLKLDHMIDLE